MEDFDTQFEFRMLFFSFAFLLSVGLVIETRLEEDLGAARMSRTLDQIEGTSGFRDLCSIAWDYK